MGGEVLTDEQGTLLLQVKWKGYDDPSDQTMESEENLMYALCWYLRDLQSDPVLTSFVKGRARRR